MSLKVIGGEWRGRNLASVRGVGTRPLLGQVREALFNILQDRIGDAEVWDLFAGTGASGIEALSRGAGRVIFVEKANKVLSVLRDNLALFGDDAADRSHVIRADAWEPPAMQLEIAGAASAEDPDGDPAEGPAGDGSESVASTAPDAAAGDDRPPDVIFLDPPYAMVSEDPARSVYRALALHERLAPGGVLCFHFPDGVLHEDDFDPQLDLDLRVWGTSAVALLKKP